MVESWVETLIFHNDDVNYGPDMSYHIQIIHSWPLAHPSTFWPPKSTKLRQQFHIIHVQYLVLMPNYKLGLNWQIIIINDHQWSSIRHHLPGLPSPNHLFAHVWQEGLSIRAAARRRGVIWFSMLIPASNKTGWWFQHLWNILVNGDDYSQYMGK